MRSRCASSIAHQGQQVVLPRVVHVWATSNHHHHLSGSSTRSTLTSSSHNDLNNNDNGRGIMNSSLVLNQKRLVSTSSRTWSPHAPERPTDAKAYATPSDEYLENSKHTPLSPEAKKWWPDSQDPGQLRQSIQGNQHIRGKKMHNDGLNVPIVNKTPSPLEPPKLADETYDLRHKTMAFDTVFEHERRFPMPPTFDPAIDDIDETMHADAELSAEINAAVEHDRKRLEAFSNPVTVEDQIDALLAPQRYDEKNMAHRADFNGFAHWGLLHGAMIALEEQQDFKRAHQLVNQYLRDQDLFVAWLKHPKVVAHIDKKFGVDISDAYDKMIGMAMSMYVRGKIQAFEGDMGSSLKSLTASVAVVTEGGDLESNERHRKMLGATLAARGTVLTKLQSYERANEDFTKALSFVAARRAASLYQLRAECREQLGLIEEARRDEEQAAAIWERADVITPGMDGEPTKFVI